MSGVNLTKAVGLYDPRAKEIAEAQRAGEEAAARIVAVVYPPNRRDLSTKTEGGE